MKYQYFVDRIAKRAAGELEGLLGRIGVASTELLLLMLPLVLSSIPHLIAHKFSEFKAGPDVIMFCAVLFADGWWKVRARHKLDPFAKECLELLGVIGATIASAVAMCIYFEQLRLLNISLHSNDFLEAARKYVFDIAVVYAFWVRIRPDARAKEVEVG